MTTARSAWRRRWHIAGTWAVVAAVFFAILVALYGVVMLLPVCPVLFFLPLVFSVIPLAATTLPWAVVLRVLAWVALTITGLVIGLSTVPSWLLMGLAAIIGVANLRNPAPPQHPMGKRS